VPRAVLDTNVLVSALISPGGPSAALLFELQAGAFELIVSPALLAELREVLARPKFHTRITPAEVAGYVDLIEHESTIFVDPPPAVTILSVDQDDQFLLELASAAAVDALVSGDSHLLDLRGVVPVMTPAEFLSMLANR
jgi:putative PIN family toxin of toxin-antitoxin system